jgi:hypothetical protein
MISLLIVFIIILLLCHRLFGSSRKPVYTSCVSNFTSSPHDNGTTAPVAEAPSIHVGESDNSYQSYMVNVGLDSSVIDSHKQFTSDLQSTTTGASTETVFSHSNDIVPFHGLRRHSANIPVDSTSREVPSHTNDQLKENSSPLKYGYF